MLRATALLLLAVSAQALTNTGHFRSWYSYDIPTVGNYDLQFRGKTCKNAHLNVLALHHSTTTDGEVMGVMGKYYMSIESNANSYSGTQACTYTAAGGVAGICGKRIFKQDSITASPITAMPSGTALPVLASATDQAKSPLFMQLQFKTGHMEACTNTATAVSHAGHSHRRSGSHATGTFSIAANIQSTGRWFFYSDQDLDSYEFKIKSDATGEHVAVAKKEVHADPNKCSAETESTVCKCDCDSEKYMWAGIIFFVGLVGCLPVFFKQLATNKKFEVLLGLFNCFGGGTLLAVAITHVYPEALDLYPSKNSGDYPASAMMCAGGYWMLLMADKVLLSLCAPDPVAAAPATDEPGCKASEVKADTSNPLDSAQVDINLEDPASKSGSAQPQGHGSGAPNSDVGCDDHDPVSGSIWHVGGVFLAMALHSVLAGLAVGLKCEKSNMENLCIAIVCHKAFDVFVVGIMLVRAQSSLVKALPIVIFVAAMTPIGVLIGVAGENMDVKVNGSLQAIAAGTFLYVAIQEVLASEFAKPGNMVLKGFATLGGISVIALASIANTSGGHSH